MSSASILRPPSAWAPLLEWFFAWMRPSHDSARAGDLNLVRDALDGVPGAQDQLLRVVLPHVRAVATAIVGRGSEVDDAVQVATLAVLDDLSGYRGDARLVRWARTVAARVCLRLRAKRRRWLRNVDLAKTVAKVDASPEYDLPQDVAGYLDRLPEAQREALVLRHVLGHTVAEVAELTGAPRDTTKSRLLAGRRALRQMLAEDSGGRHG